MAGAEDQAVCPTGQLASPAAKQREAVRLLLLMATVGAEVARPALEKAPISMGQTPQKTEQLRPWGAVGDGPSQQRHMAELEARALWA